MKKTLLLLAVVFLASTVPVFAGTITETGNLSDWGITAGTDGRTMNWTSPYAGVTSLVDPVRDTNGYNNPGWGGAEFDAYAMYFAKDSVNFYFGIATGVPQTGRNDTAGLLPNDATQGRQLFPGDLALNFQGASGSYQYGIRLNNVQGAHSGQGVIGGFYQVTEWNKAYEGNYPPYQVSDPTIIKTAGAKLGDATVTYKDNTVPGGDPLFLYEVVVPDTLMDKVQLLNWNGKIDAHWTMACGNDSLTMRNLTVTPEPVSLVLFGLGAGVLGLTKLRRKKK